MSSKINYELQLPRIELEVQWLTFQLSQVVWETKNQKIWWNRSDSKQPDCNQTLVDGLYRLYLVFFKKLWRAFPSTNQGGWNSQIEFNIEPQGKLKNHLKIFHLNVQHSLLLSKMAATAGLTFGKFCWNVLLWKIMFVILPAN